MEYIPIDREKVRAILAAADDPAHRTEKYLCEVQGITYPTYWRRFTKRRWKREHVLSLGITLGRIAGRGPYSESELRS
jgi:hypothetical protein